jgi:multidrug efflux system membrane fusion protein
MLWPGAFINLRIQLGLLRGALTVPLAAVQRGPDGAYAFVVRADSTVEQRPLALGLITASQAVVLRGLTPGEQVVTSGGLRLTNGAEVIVAEPVRAAPVAPPPVGEGRRRGPRPGGGAPAAP